MPGPKYRGARSSAPDNAIVSAVEVSEEPQECPSTEGYVSMRMRRTKTADGIIEEPEFYWTKKKLGDWLGLCPKVDVYIPLDRERGQTDPKTAPPHPVYYDGFRIDIPVGRNVLVALPIAEIIRNMQTEVRTAQAHGIDLYVIDPDNPDDHGFEIPALAAAAG